jgi:hypothetical protein
MNFILIVLAAATARIAGQTRTDRTAPRASAAAHQRQIIAAVIGG